MCNALPSVCDERSHTCASVTRAVSKAADVPPAARGGGPRRGGRPLGPGACSLNPSASPKCCIQSRSHLAFSTLGEHDESLPWMHSNLSPDLELQSKSDRGMHIRFDTSPIPPSLTQLITFNLSVIISSSSRGRWRCRRRTCRCSRRSTQSWATTATCQWMAPAAGPFSKYLVAASPPSDIFLLILWTFLDDPGG